jgi:hypothetical protein
MERVAARTEAQRRSREAEKRFEDIEAEDERERGEGAVAATEEATGHAEAA